MINSNGIIRDYSSVAEGSTFINDSHTINLKNNSN